MRRATELTPVLACLSRSLQEWRKPMTTSTQQKSKPPTYGGLDTEEDFDTDRVVVNSPHTTNNSSTPVVIVVVAALMAVIAYFIYANSGTPDTVDVTPPVTMEKVDPAPVPSDPVPVAPAPPAPAVVDPVPAPVAPVN